MDLELRKESYVFYNAGFDMPGMREETSEAIVPDALPDILRIVECHGTAMITSREIKDGQVIVKGRVKAFAVYVPESGEGLEKIEVTLPFTQVFEAHGEVMGVLLCSAELQSIDCRTINSRKILVRATIRTRVRLMETRSFSLCSGIRGKVAETANVQLLNESRMVKLPIAVKTKSFIVQDEVEVPPARPQIREIIKWNCKLLVGDYNIIGRKVVFKGTIQFKVLCKGNGTGLDDIFEYEFEMPFSQIVEIEGLDESADCYIALQAEDINLYVGNESDGRILVMAVGMEAQVSAYATKRLEAISDLYSTSMGSTVEIRPYNFTNLVERTTRRQTFRDTIETEVPVRVVKDMEVLFEDVAVTSGDGFVRLDTNAEAKILYIGEDGDAYHASKKLPVSVRLEAPDEILSYSKVSSASEAFSAAAVNGVEIRFDACFDIELTGGETIMSVFSAALEEYGDKQPVRPSVVLKYSTGNENLWSMAKRYNTTEDDIRAANGLEQQENPELEQLLLIPKRR